ncbi:MAG: DNA alkylation repair protein [Chthoniobacterales bacterium]|nr:DNA alkylation repair protein [Chthoniobacterales bacterium]
MSKSCVTTLQTSVRKSAPKKPIVKEIEASVEEQVQGALRWLKRHSSKRTRDGMARYAIPSDNALGVSVADIRTLAKRLGRNHELALALWKSGIYEARMLTSFVAEPARVTAEQMDRWCRDFDSWAICDTLCFHLFDRTPHAFAKISQWSDKRTEFEKRAAFALLASLALHDKKAGDEPFLKTLPLIERAATDERNFVKKGVSWALRGVGRRNAALNAAAVILARRLLKSSQIATRWVGRDALKELASPKMMQLFAKRSAK